MLSERVHGPFGPRRRGPHGDLRQGARSERQVGERRAARRTARSSRTASTRRFSANTPTTSNTSSRRSATTRYLNLGLTLNFNGKSYVSKNGLLDLRERQHDRGAALSADPPHGRRHRGGDHPRHGLRRELRLVRQRPAHHRRAARTRRPCARPSPRPSRSSTTRTTTPRTSARRSSRPFRSRSPTRSSRTR